MENDILYDEERIGTIFSDISRYLKDLEDLGIHSVQVLHDKRNFYASSMILFSLLNRDRQVNFFKGMFFIFAVSRG